MPWPLTWLILLRILSVRGGRGTCEPEPRAPRHDRSRRSTRVVAFKSSMPHHESPVTGVSCVGSPNKKGSTEPKPLYLLQRAFLRSLVVSNKIERVTTGFWRWKPEPTTSRESESSVAPLPRLYLGLSCFGVPLPCGLKWKPKGQPHKNDPHPGKRPIKSKEFSLESLLSGFLSFTGRRGPGCLDPIWATKHLRLHVGYPSRAPFAGRMKANLQRTTCIEAQQCDSPQAVVMQHNHRSTMWEKRLPISAAPKNYRLHPSQGNCANNWRPGSTSIAPGFFKKHEHHRTSSIKVPGAAKRSGPLQLSNRLFLWLSSRKPRLAFDSAVQNKDSDQKSNRVSGIWLGGRFGLIGFQPHDKLAERPLQKKKKKNGER